MRKKLAALAALIAISAPAAALRRKPAASARPTTAARRWMRSLTLQEKVAQLIFIPFHGAAPNTRSREYRQFVHLVRDVRVGGLILVNWAQHRVIQKAEPHALGAFINRMQRLAKLPLIVSADFERGASMRVADTTVFPHAMAFGATGDPAFSRYEGEVTAREARALGVQWVFYPVADVNNNPDNPIINIRSFGEDPQLVSAHVKAFIEGAHSDPKNRVLTTAKHFPGHGDTAVDSHLNMAVINSDREHLNRIEFAPFRAAIAAGVDSIMTAHLAVPALAPADIPATLSPAILTGVLRDQLGFKGIVVTDALEMGGIARGFSAGEAAVRALEAGADALLMSPDPDAALKAVMAAIRSGRLTQKRIEDSLARILAAKQATGLDRKRFVDLEAIADVVDSPESNEKAQEIADRAVTLVRNNGNLVPLRETGKTCFFALPEGRYSTSGQVFAEQVRRRAKNALVKVLDPTELPAPDLSNCAVSVIAAFASVAAYRGASSAGDDVRKFMESFTGKPAVLVAMGNPYMLREFPNVAAYLATFSTVPPSEMSAVKALFGEIAIRGHMPVSIPGFAKLGDGIMLPAR